MAKLLIVFESDGSNHRMLLPTGERCKLTISFDYNNHIDTIITASSVGCYITNLGEIDTSYEMKNLLIVPSFFTFTVLDSKDFLTKIFFNEGGQYAPHVLSKEAEVTLQILNNQVFVNEFTGKIKLDELEYPEAEKTFEFKAAPSTNILNETKLFDLDGNPTNPLGYSTYDQPELLKDLIEKIYRKVDPNASLNINHHWLFHYEFGSYNYFNGSIENVNVNISKIFQDKSYGFETLADVLRSLANSFCCITGVEKSEYPFFLPFHSPAQSLPVGNKVISILRTFKSLPIQYVRVTVEPPTNQSPYIWEAGVYTDIKDKTIEVKTPVVTDAQGPTGQGNWHSNLWLVTNQGMTLCFAIKDPDIVYSPCNSWYDFTQLGGDSNFVPNGRLIADYWLKHRGGETTSIFYVIKLVGTDFSITNNYVIDGKKYRPFKIVRNLQEGYTELEAILLNTTVPASPGLNNPSVLSDKFLSGKILGEIPLSTESLSFTTRKLFQSASTELYLNGMRLTLNEDYTESNNNTITFIQAIPPESNVLINYQIL